jgi:hypothetical protein
MTSIRHKTNRISFLFDLFIGEKKMFRTKFCLKSRHFLFNTPLELIYKGQNKKNTIFTDQTFMNLSCILAALHI